MPPPNTSSLREPAGARPRLNCRKSCNRAELLLFVEKFRMDEAIAARLLGFVAPEAESGHPTVEADGAPGAAQRRRRAEAATASAVVEGPPLWRVIGPVVRPYDPKAQQVPGLLNGPAYSESELAGVVTRPPPHVPIVPRGRLGLVLRSLLLIEEPDRRVDEQKLVGLLARSIYPTRVPKRRRRVWPSRLQIYWDQSQLLWPFRVDQFEVVQWLRRWRGEQGLDEVIIDHKGRVQCYRAGLGGLPRKPRPPDSGTTILALSDLGCARAGDPRRLFWRSLGQQADRAGTRLRALVLSSPDRWESWLVRRWGGICWGNARPSGCKSATIAGIGEAARERSVNRLFEMLAPAVRIEWELLGSARRRLLSGPSDLLTEVDIWADPRAAARNPLGFAINAESRRELLESFRLLEERQRGAMKELLEEHHQSLSPVVLAEELMALGDEASKREGVERLAQCLRLLLARGAPTEAELAHALRFEARQGSTDWSDEVKAVFWALHHARGARFDEPLPEGLSIEQVRWALNRVPTPTHCSLWQRGQHLFMVPARDRELPQLDQAGVHLADMPMAVRQLELEWREGIRRLRVERLNVYGATTLAPFRDEERATSLIMRSDMATLELVLERPPQWSRAMTRDATGLVVQAFLYPPWATRVDQDEFGLYAILDLAPGFETRLRWIPPGRFLMGSPDSETGRAQYEGPQHWVELTQGFWLADAPCTQAEWQALMGQNPSHFVDNPHHPVEQVSWDDCQEFCRKLRERWPSLDARLPTEAEWEYACRAGTLGAYNDGSDCTEPQGADPALLKLGWFDANSNGKTQPVRNREFKPNAWGLNDMHGNVLEWCADYWQDNYAAIEQQDLRGPADGAGRVIRGGCWGGRARYCRSAFRFRWHSSERVNDLGFRLVAGPVSQAAEPQLQVGQAGGASGRWRRDEGRGAQAAEGERSQQGFKRTRREAKT